MKMPHSTIVQPVPVSPCIAMAKGRLASAQIARKHVGNAEIHHQISRHQITSNSPQQ